MNHRNKRTTAENMKKDDPSAEDGPPRKVCGANMGLFMRRGNHLVQLVTRLFRFIVQYIGGEDEQGNYLWFNVDILRHSCEIKRIFRLGV